MICPIRNLTGHALTSECLGEKCEWWVEEPLCCAISSLAVNLALLVQLREEKSASAEAPEPGTPE